MLCFLDKDMAFRKKLIEGEKRVALAMLDKLRQLPVPLAGGELLFRPFEDAAPLSLSCVPSTMPGMAQLLDGYGCDTVLKCLSLNSFVYIFLSILLERKIIFVLRAHVCRGVAEKYDVAMIVAEFHY